VDSRRGILYAGPTFLGCVGEYSSDAGEITRRGSRLARLSVVKPIELLDLRGTAATGAGTIPAIWERARGKITCRRHNNWGLDDPRLTDEVQLAANELHLAVA
jgi:hypothetical protein